MNSRFSSTLRSLSGSEWRGDRVDDVAGFAQAEIAVTDKRHGPESRVGDVAFKATKGSRVGEK